MWAKFQSAPASDADQGSHLHLDPYISHDGITAYLKNGGKLEHAQAMAVNSSTRTTQLYGRRSDEVSLDEVERIGI